jgi:hypothetical protein
LKLNWLSTHRTTDELEETIIESVLNCNDRVCKENPAFQTWVKEVFQPVILLEYLPRPSANHTLLATLGALEIDNETS